jgi:hypothetical protein
MFCKLLRIAAAVVSLKQSKPSAEMPLHGLQHVQETCYREESHCCKSGVFRQRPRRRD